MTTVSETGLREGSEEEVPPEAALESLRRQARTRASSVALPSPASPHSVTVRVRQAGVAVAKAAVLLDKPGTLLHAQPSTFRQAHDRHRECADWFRSPVLRWLRRAYGWFHILLVKTALNGLEWVTESPLRAVIAIALIAAIWFFS